MTTDIAVVDSTYLQSSLEERKAYASAISGAGELVPPGFRNRDGSPNPAKLLLAFEYGAMLGIHPMASVKGINVIDGQTSASPALMTGLVRRAGHKLRIRKTGSWTKGDYKATVTLVRSDDPGEPYEAVWDADRAKQAGLLPASSPRSSWARYPQNMCVWRAVSEVCREGAEDVLFGLHYTPEELGAEVNEAGEVIDGEIVEDAPADSSPAPTVSKAAPASSGRQKPSAKDAPRRQPVPEPSEEQQAAIVEFADAITETDSVNALRNLHHEADQRHLLAYPTREGVRLNDLFHARKAYLAQRDAEDLPPALDGIEDDGGVV